MVIQLHSTCLTAVCNRGEIQMDSHGSSGGHQGGCPGPSDTAVQCVNPARCHPVQLTTQAGRTRCTTLLISYSIRVICTSLYTRYVHKKVQSSICSYIRGHVFLFGLYFLCAFSGVECIQSGFILHIPLVFCFSHKGESYCKRKAKTHTVSSRIKSEIQHA